MLVGPPLDHRHTEDLNAIFADIGKVLLWERDPDHKGRIIAKIRVTDLVDIPKSVRFTIGDLVETESWTFSVEVLQSHLLGGGPPEEDPLPDDNVDPHPVPAHGPVFGPQVPPPPSPLLLGVIGVSGWLLCRTLLLMVVMLKVGVPGRLLLLLFKALS